MTHLNRDGDDPRAATAAVLVIAIALVLSILGAFGCGPVILPPAPAADRPVAIQACVSDALVTLEAEPFFPAQSQITDETGWTTFAAVPANVHAFNLHITAALYATYDKVGLDLRDGNQRFLLGTCWPLGDPAIETRLVPMVSRRPFPPESGRLAVVDRHFVTEDGQPWSWRGASMFLLGARFFAGEDISPQIAWMEQRGINVARVFDNVDWDLSVFGLPSHAEVTAAQLGAFADRLATHGLRLEYVPLTYRADLDTMRARVQRAFDVASTRWNMLVETANEPENNGIDVPLVMATIDRKGVVSASGMDPGRHCDAETSDNARWNACMRREVLVLPGGYLTGHDLARDENHSPRNTKDFVIDFADIFRVPIVADEPIGIVDRNYPGYCYNSNGFASRCAGGGVRTIDCHVILSAAGIEHLYGPGFTIHLQAGLEGRAPRADEPIQSACAEQLTALWKFIPPAAQLGAYRPPHGGDYPLTWTSGDSDSLVGHAYCSTSGGQSWCVTPMPAPSWTPVAANGWRIEAVGPVRYVLRMGR